jgi:two-component system heavy metal sensor histidine kinase CusS
VDLPNKERFSAAREVQALLEFYDVVADEKRIRLSAQGDGQIFGDRLMFRRAVSNLLSNALRHTPDEGDVHIDVVEGRATTEITVENTGQDIDPLVLPRLFDRFYRADPARSHPDSDGTGLGLSITKAIVEAHGGNASARSGEGKTQFTLSFPH